MRNQGLVTTYWWYAVDKFLWQYDMLPFVGINFDGFVKSLHNELNQKCRCNSGSPVFAMLRQFVTFKGIQIVTCVNMTTTSVWLLDKFDRNFVMLVYLKSENSSCWQQKHLLIQTLSYLWWLSESSLYFDEKERNHVQIKSGNCVIFITVVTLVFRSARTSCTTFGWSVRPVCPFRAKNLDHLYTPIYALWIMKRLIKPIVWPHGIPLDALLTP